ncbi:MAG: glutamate--tRNA ligase, partial [Chitinophagaceae bacterium]|nr:glutamate--tRNA ligase [Chitinophagaceae bacterium]
GAKFDYEKAKWFNHEWIKQMDAQSLLPVVKTILEEKGLTINNDQLLEKVIGLVKERCTLLPDFYEQSSFFFQRPVTIDTDSVKPKWNEAKQLFFAEVIRNFQLSSTWDAHELENNFKEMAAVNKIKPGEVLLPFRIMLVGGKFGPHVFDIAALIGKEETIQRIKNALSLLA